MNDHDMTRIVGAWLRDDGHEDGERVLDAVLQQIDMTPQRHHWWRGRRAPLMNTRLGIGLAAVAIIAAAAITLPALLRPGPGVGATPTPSPTVSPAGSGPLLPRATGSTPPDVTSLKVNVPIEGGTYTVTVGGVVPPFTVDLTLPDGWILYKRARGEVAFAAERNRPYPFIDFLTVFRTYKDPCHPELGYQGSDPAIEYPTFEDLERELHNLEGFQATPSTSLTIDGYEARAFVLSNQIDTDAADCSAGPLLPLFVTDDVVDLAGEPTRLEFSPATNGGTTQRVWIVRRDQWPLLIIGEVEPDGDQETQLAKLNEIIDSIDIR